MMPTRRELLQLLGASTALLATGCTDDVVEGVTAVLDPGEDALTVATWSRQAWRAASVVVDGGGRVAQVPLELADAIGAAQVTGLAPDTRYDVEILADGAVRGRHRVRTAPRADDPRPVRLAIVADYDPNPEFASGVVDALVDAAPEATIAIGDFPYTDNGPAAESVAQYRLRHAEMRGHPPVRALLETCGLYAIYDDHEFRNDWDAARAGEEPARHAAAMQVWDEFFAPRATGEVRYRSWRWGAHLACFLLDCRRFRSANSTPDGPAKTMLGAPQLAWLIDAIARSTATFKLVLTSVPLDFGNGNDHWSAFKTERDALFDALAGIPGVVFASADQHWFAAHRHARGIREFQVGPLRRGLGSPPGAAPGVLFRAARFNAGVVDVDGDRLTFTGLGDDGAFYSETLSPADLTPSA